MQVPPSTAINLNINLIKFPPFHQHSNKHSQPSYSNPITNNPITLKNNHQNFIYQNFEDSSSSFEQFHPTMSTESLTKAKKIYQKTIKSKKNHNHSIDQFYNLQINLKHQPQHSKVNSHLNSKNQQIHSNTDNYSQKSQKSITSSNKNSQNDKYLINKTNPSQKQSQTQSYNHSSSSSKSSYQQRNILPAKQPIGSLQIDCQDTFEEHESNDFVEYGLFSQHFKKETISDRFKKKKSTKNISNQQTIKLKGLKLNEKTNKSIGINQRKDKKTLKNNNLVDGNSYNQKSQSKSQSRSKSKSRSRSKIQGKSTTQTLKKLNLKKTENKPTNIYSKNVTSTSRNRSKSKSPYKKSIDNQVNVKGRINDNKMMDKKRNKSRSHQKNIKQFIRSKQQLPSHQTFSPSPQRQKNTNKSRSSISKSKSKQKSRSRSNSQIKSYSNSKFKFKNQKSIHNKNTHHQNKHSPSNNKNYKKPSIKQFNQKSTSQLYQQKHSHSKSNKKTLSKQKILKKSNPQLKSKKSSYKQPSVNIKQISHKQPSKNILTNQFTKNESKKVSFAKNDANLSPSHSKSTNFYHPGAKQNKQKKNTTKKTTSNKSQQQESKKISQKASSIQKSKLSSSKKQKAQEQILLKSYQILKSVITIQRFYRGYRVRKQLNQDLAEICSKVEQVREKISDKKSKYWIKSDDKNSPSVESNRKNKNDLSNSLKEFRNTIRSKNEQNEERKTFESILSSSNSIQNIESGRSKTSEKREKLVTGKQNEDESSFLINYPEQHSKSSLNLPQDQIRYLQQLVSRDFELNKKLMKENQQLKDHIRSISSEHMRSTDVWREERNPWAKKSTNQNQLEEQQLQQKSIQPKNALNEPHTNEISQKPNTNLITDQQDQIKVKKSQSAFNKPDIIIQDTKAFQFYEPYSPKHYIVSPKHNPSPSLSKLVSPISNSSSMFNHNQIPFSLQSPQNILESQKRVNFIEQNQANHINNQDKKYFQAQTKQTQPHINSKKEQVLVSDENDKKIQMLNKLFYQDKLLSPKTYQMKLNKLRNIKPQQKKQQKVEVPASPYNLLVDREQLQLHDLMTSQEKQEVNEEKVAPSITRKVKLTELTESLEGGNGQKMSISKALFKFEAEGQKKEQKQMQKLCEQNKDEKEGVNRVQAHQEQAQEQEQEQVQIGQVNFKRSSNQQGSQPQPRMGFPTQLLFIKNYIFEFFQFIKTHPPLQKQLLTNLLNLPFDNEHLLTCYRTQLQEIDPYYEEKIQAHFLSYPYWKNLIDYQPVLSTELFQQFSHTLENKKNNNDQETNQWFALTPEQQKIFTSKFGHKIGLKDLQRIFLMMLMDVFNQAFEDQRCSYTSINLLRQQKGGMNNFKIVSKALNKIQQIQSIQKSTPAYYLEASHNSQAQNDLQSSNNHQFFLIHSLRREKQELVDVIFCSILKRVLQNWGRQMCGLIIEPEEEDEMQITIEQIQAKNTQRLCLALNKYVQEYEKELGNVMREHQLCTKLILTDRILEELLWQVVSQIEENGKQ